VLSFSKWDEAAQAITHLAREPDRHERAARALAAAYFDSDSVLTDLIDRALG
jgi:hypothetical protein